MLVDAEKLQLVIKAIEATGSGAAHHGVLQKPFPDLVARAGHVNLSVSNALRTCLIFNLSFLLLLLQNYKACL